MKSQINFADSVLKSHDVVVQIPSEDAVLEFYRQYVETLQNTSHWFSELWEKQYFARASAAFYRDNGYQIVQYDTLFTSHCDDLTIDEEELDPVDIEEFLTILFL